MSPNEPAGNFSAFEATITGRVQGVYFRAFVKQNATKLGLKGHVHNHSDGSVRVYAEGPKQQLDKLIEALKKGPLGAKVDNTEISWIEHRGEYSDFSITR